MKKILIVISLLLAGTSEVLACDACGCQLGGLSLSMLPQHYRHFVGVRYSQAHFTAHMDHDSEYFENEYSNDVYRTAELMGRISIGERWKLNFIMPYLVNDMDGSHQKVKSDGFGDPKLLAYYSVFANKDSVMSLWKHVLMIGGGVKLPVGEYKKEDNGTIVNRNFQMGSGSVDYLISAIYSVSYGMWGTSLESAYKLNTKNNQEYQFGNQFNASMYVFRYFGVGNVVVLPYAGLFYEYAQKHTDGLVVQQNTGGTSVLGTYGARVSLKAVSLNAQFQNPISQNYNSDDIANIKSKNRFSIGLMVNIAGK